MYILTKLLQITLLLFMSLTLAIIPWIPSLVVENIVNFMVVGLFIFAGYLVYLLVKRLYQREDKQNLYITALYALLLLIYVGLFAIFQIGVSLSKSEYMKTYTFDNNTFYTYKTHSGGTEVSRKESYFPIRSLPMASFEYVPIVLEKEGHILYANGEGVHQKVYDFNTTTNKENNE